jgi:hypothetical protein
MSNVDILPQKRRNNQNLNENEKKEDIEIETTDFSK